MSTAQALLKIAQANAALEAGLSTHERGDSTYGVTAPDDGDLNRLADAGALRAYASRTDALAAAADALNPPISEDMRKAIDAVTVLDYACHLERLWGGGVQVQVDGGFYTGKDNYAALAQAAEAIRESAVGDDD